MSAQSARFHYKERTDSLRAMTLALKNWAIIASLIETCKLSKIEPHSYLTGVLTAIVNGHKQKDIDQLLPWSFNA